jgi:hypothetical protein
MRLSLAILFSAGLLASAAYAAETQDPAPVQAGSGNQRICRVMVFQGAITHRECHTAREWNSIRQYNQRQFKEFQDRGLLVKHT